MPDLATLRSASGIWIHRDANPAEAIANGYARALAGDWRSGTLAERVRAFQALLVERSMLMGSLAGTIELNPAEGLAALINPSPRRGTSGAPRELAIALYSTAGVFALRTETDVHIETSSSPSETGFVIAWPVAAIAIAIVVAGAAAIAYCAHQAAEIADRQLGRNEDAQRLAAKDAELMKLVREHQEQEQKTGRALPLSEAERLALQALQAQQQAIIAKPDGGIDSGLPSFGGGSLLSGLGGVALGVAGGFVLSKIL
jgi:hypothetical protein